MFNTERRRKERKLRTERLFIVVVVSIVIFGFCSTMNMVSASEGVTSASGYQEIDDDEKGADGIGNNAIFGGNVGIGTMNPLARLHIFGSPGVDGIMFPDGTLQTTASTNGWSDTFWQKENSSIFNTNNGNVGIGTNTPKSKLEVKGNIKAKSVNGNDVVSTQTFQIFPAGHFSFTTEEISYSSVTKYLNGGLLSQFLEPSEGTKRYYRLKVTYTDNITESDGVAGSNLRYIEDEGNAEIFNFVLEYSSASGDWINQRISDRFIYDGIEVTRMEFRSGVKGKYLQIYGIWIIAEDVIE